MLDHFQNYSFHDFIVSWVWRFRPDEEDGVVEVATKWSQLVCIGLENGNYMAVILVSSYVSRSTTFLKTAACKILVQNGSLFS